MLSGCIYLSVNHAVYVFYCSSLIGIFEVTFQMLPVGGQQHSFSKHERMSLWKSQSFWDRKFLDLRGAGFSLCCKLNGTSETFRSGTKWIKFFINRSAVLYVVVFFKQRNRQLLRSDQWKLLHLNTIQYQYETKQTQCMRLLTYIFKHWTWLYVLLIFTDVLFQSFLNIDFHHDIILQNRNSNWAGALHFSNRSFGPSPAISWHIIRR